MQNTTKEEKVYPSPIDKVQQAIYGAVDGLEGKVTNHDKEKGLLTVQFNKTILGKVLGERTQLEISINSISSEECSLALATYPLDALGRKLMFGARKGVSKTVMDWFIAHLEHRL